jgi:predicted nuclease with TOPRIM domain
MDDAIKRYEGKNAKEDRKKRSKVLFTFTLLLTVIVITMVYAFLPGILGDKETSPQIRQMRQLTAEVGKLETFLKKREEEFSNLVKKYYEQTGENLPELSALDLSAGQMKVLEEKIKSQKDVSMQELLNDILEKTNEISSIKETIKKYETLLPKPHIVIEGENHYQIAMSFLINEKNIEIGRARWLVERTALFDPLISRFRVWNFYSEGEFGTFVTQGDAHVSPGELSRQTKKQLMDARDKAISEKERLSAEIKILQKARDNIMSEKKNLSAEKEKLNEQLKNFITENEALNKQIQRMLNSLSYMVDLESNLKEKDILKSKFLGSPKLTGISSEYFNQTIDLRDKQTIEIFAQKFILPRIRDINLYPTFYEKGKDYRVEIDKSKQKAVLIFLAVDKFKTGRVIISVK